VVGGTGFYLRWFVHGAPTAPASTPEAAAQVERMLAEAWQQAAAEAQAAPSSSDAAAGAEHCDSAPSGSPTGEAAPAAAGQTSQFEAMAARAAAGLSEQERWDVACRVVARLGDAESAERLRGEINNFYRWVAGWPAGWQC